MKKNPPRSRSKRPTATLNLKAEEVKKDTPEETPEKETPEKETTAKETAASRKSVTSSTSKPASPGASASSGNSNPATATASQTARPQNDAKKEIPTKDAVTKNAAGTNAAKGAKPAPASSSGGGFISHLLASVIGAVLGIFGLSYANNQNMLPPMLQISGGQGVQDQVASLSSKIGNLEKQASSNDANSLGGRLASLMARVEKTEKSLGDGPSKTDALTQKVTRLETTISDLERAAQTGKGGQLAGLTAVTKQLSEANKRSLALENELIKLREAQSSFREDLTSVRSAQADFQTSSAKISDELAKMANSTAKIVANANRPPDISSQINPVRTLLDKLSARIDGVMNREAGSKAEGRNIALALSLGELKRAVNQGTPYADELARVLPHAPKSLDLSVLLKFADKGLVTRKALRSTFSSYSNKALASRNTAQSGGFMDQIMANAKSMVQVRPTGLVKGDTTGAVLSRMEYKLDRNDLVGSLKESQALGGQAKDVVQPWLDQASSRLGGDTVLRSLEDKIRNSLAGNEQQ